MNHDLSLWERIIEKVDKGRLDDPKSLKDVHDKFEHNRVERIRRMVSERKNMRAKDKKVV